MSSHNEPCLPAKMSLDDIILPENDPSSTEATTPTVGSDIQHYHIYRSPLGMSIAEDTNEDAAFQVSAYVNAQRADPHAAKVSPYSTRNGLKDVEDEFIPASIKKDVRSYHRARERPWDPNVDESVLERQSTLPSFLECEARLLQLFEDIRTKLEASEDRGFVTTVLQGAQYQPPKPKQIGLLGMSGAGK